MRLPQRPVASPSRLEHDVGRAKATLGLAAAGALAFVVAGCGGSSTAGTSPTPTPPSGGGTSATITIAANAANPKNVAVTRGRRVTFVNNDNQPHDMEQSDRQSLQGTITIQ